MDEARWVVALAALCGVVVLGQTTTGCGSDEAAFPSSSSGSGGAGASSSGVGGQAGDCPTVPGYDPVAAGLPSCCDTGNAHCVPVGEVPVALAPNFDPCDAQGGGQGLCLPDAVILAGTDYEAPPCTSFGDAEGVCFSKCIPAVANDPATALLPQDVCADDELCVPCVNPLDGTSTGACELEICPSGAGGAGGTGGEGGAAPACPHEGPPVVDPDIFDPCTPACPGAHCLPAALIPAAQQALLEPCTSGGNAGFCAPDVLIETGGNFIPPTCESVGGAEGRCISACLPDVAAQAAFLPQATCDASERCVPCYDPFTQLSTGVCNLSCDPGPVEPPLELTCPWEGPPLIDPSTLPECDPACGGAHCLPEALVGPAEQALLAPCPGGFCAPDLLIETAGQTPPPSCVSVAGAEGRCLSTCLPDIAAQAAFLPQSSCAAEERCVPCYDPTAADPTLPTGACSLACDAPVDPPTVITCPWNGPPIIDPATFPACDPACNGAHCLPEALVGPAEQALLAPCPGGFCAPDLLIETAGQTPPPSCVSVAGAEGRCLSTCLPDIAAQAAFLPQSSCAAEERCVPCYDPTAADPTLPTGACSLACDAPVDPPTIITCPWNGPPLLDPATFPECDPVCGGAHCVPDTLVPVDQQALLAACPGGFCLPDPLISTAGNYLPQSCTAFPGTTSEGRCLSDCLPVVAAQIGSLSQDVCASGEHCVPCYDPFTGLETGACSSTSCDAPVDPPYTFPTCCPFQGTDQGTCLPSALIPPDDQANLLQHSCPTDMLCIPNEYLPDPPIPIATCTSWLGSGVCVSECLDGVPGLGQADCPGNHVCVPCWLAPTTPGC